MLCGCCADTDGTQERIDPEPRAVLQQMPLEAARQPEPKTQPREVEAQAPAAPASQPVETKRVVEEKPVETKMVEESEKKPEEKPKETPPPEEEKPKPATEEKKAAAATSAPPAATSTEFEVVIQKTAAMSKIGLDVDKHSGENVKVLKVKEGLVAAYNKTAAATGKPEIRAGHEIYDINGITGNPVAMVDAVGKAQTVTLKIRSR
mmetsp:Transcript_19355/g.42237  ORF Transcript_19355/g.42237 Transcript_19355/m.42237 type:complete len:206 (+) Transcript_19355:71-688(+)|eukprot:CAMPEP_0170613262 /NCGR_PEP_ID=MMETSP0224-20130122/24178_1 /TAXON_ID=285029 /ORGANISM="Togula jolla, Strain CCCM 725" /LENGTH=205 /DNA_ID=CAMNT_0010938851 /DNA_START=67 /DNA_END=684 /DNA_ORIENTATION=+